MPTDFNKINNKTTTRTGFLSGVSHPKNGMMSSVDYFLIRTISSILLHTCSSNWIC